MESDTPRPLCTREKGEIRQSPFMPVSISYMPCILSESLLQSDSARPAHAMKGQTVLSSLPQERMAVAINGMIVDHADCLHEGVDDDRAAKPEATRFQVLGDGFR